MIPQQRFVKACALAAALAPIAFAEVDAQIAWSPTRMEAAPTIDGVLDEPAWRSAETTSGFRTFSPDYGHPMLSDTRVYMGYDDRNMYFAFEASDPEPSLIRASVTTRDNIRQDDWVAINLDSFGDAQSLYAFYVNPHGIQSDTRYAGGTEDPGVDLVWFSAARITDSGYTVEIRIPFQSIRFEAGDSVQMGVIFERRIARVSQWGTSPELDPELDGQWLNQMHPLSYRDVESPRVLEALPAVTYTHDRAAADGSLATQLRGAEYSLTTKVGLTSDLVLDGTYNPDFSQVEADATEVDVNLRSAVFYPEKRPFFLEGREHFGLAAMGGASPLRSAVYTRRITDPVVGAKVSGKLGERHTVSTIYALDDLVEPSTGATSHAQIPVARYKLSLSRDSFLGAIYAGRETSTRSNRLGGLDGQVRLGRSGQLAFHALRTTTDVEGEPSTEAGHAISARLSASTRRLTVGLDVLDVHEAFQPDVGFLLREGIFRGATQATVRFYPAWANVRRLDIETSSSWTFDHPSGLWESSRSVGLANQLFGSMVLRARVRSGTEVFRGARFTSSGASLTATGLLGNRGGYRLVYNAGRLPIYSVDPEQGRSRSVSAQVELKPSPHLDAALSLTTTNIVRDIDAEELFDVTIARLRTTIQPNRFAFFRAITEYDWFRERLVVDLLASFTYIPGTVLHVGYGSLLERTRWDGSRYAPGPDLNETKRRLFFKTSYLFRN
jgi:hypothetical protein